MPRGKKKDLFSLEVDLGRRNQPKEKSKRTLETKIVELCHSLCGISTEQIVLVFQCVLRNLEREDLLTKDQTEKIILSILENIKSCKSHDASVVKKVLCAVVANQLEDMRRDDRRKYIPEKFFESAKEGVQKLMQKDFTWLKNVKHARKTNEEMSKLAIDFYDEMSVPVKFSKTGKRILCYSVQKIFQLFQDRHKLEYAADKGISRSSFYRLRQERHLSHQKATFYTCPRHMLAQSALEEAKAALVRYHRNEACDQPDTCEKCKFIRAFPSTVHDFVNNKLSPCQQREPHIQCMQNKCEKCFLHPTNHLKELFEGAEIDLTDENLGDETLVYSLYEDEKVRDYKIKELKHYRDVPQKVLSIWAKQLSEVVPHQITVWAMRDAVHGLTQMPHPRLPESVALVHFDYQQNLELSQVGMQAAQKFSRVKTTAKTIITDVRWGAVKDESIVRPEIVPSEDFQNEICRIATTHLRGGHGQKHNAQTALDSLDHHLAWLKKIAPDIYAALFDSDGSPKEYRNAVFLRGLTALGVKHDLQIIHLFHAAAHGSTPCDAEQRVVKEFNDDLGTQNKTFADATRNLCALLNSNEGQPIVRAKTLLRRAEVLPSMETSASVLKSLGDTRSFSAYWTIKGEEDKMYRRIFLCTKQDCCAYVNQSPECKYTDIFGEVQEVSFEIDPQKQRARSRPQTRARRRAKPTGSDEKSASSSPSAQSGAPQRRSALSQSPEASSGSSSASTSSNTVRLPARRKNSPGTRPGRGKRAQKK